MRTGLLFCFLLSALLGAAQPKDYPKNYFRSPLDIPMQLVANFGELRNNHWHMGLDIRTQQRENLPVHAAADGYISAVSIDATGFGRAIYITHPNGFTTLYAHLNNFAPALHQWVKQQQYKAETWAMKIPVPEGLFPVKKGDFIAYSGNTGGSQGPHVHFEIRDTKTDKVLNPLLFGFPIADAVPPTLVRLALYDRTKSVYSQSPKLLALKKAGGEYELASSDLLKVASPRVSFAIGAVDRLSNTPNPNGIYSARILMDGELQSEFALDGIDYNETRYLNAQIDYRYKAGGGAYLQHLSKMPGEESGTYTPTESNGVLQLQDNAVHQVTIEVRDAYQNRSRLQFSVQYEGETSDVKYASSVDQLLPRNVNVFEAENFELYTSEYALYDTVNIAFTTKDLVPAGAVSPQFHFLSAYIPVHDSVIVRIKPSRELSAEEADKVVIKGVSGSRTVVQKGILHDGWITAKFRQFGSFQAFIDDAPPTVNAPATNLRSASRIVFHPDDNFDAIKMVRAEVDGQWLLLTNDKGYSYIYNFDEHFPRGEHELKVTVQDAAGNTTTKVWNVVR